MYAFLTLGGLQLAVTILALDAGDVETFKASLLGLGGWATAIYFSLRQR